MLDLLCWQAGRRREAAEKLFAVRSECAIRWAEATDGSYTATVSFNDPNTLESTAQHLGGGVRGLFSVVMVEDAPPTPPALLVSPYAKEGHRADAIRSAPEPESQGEMTASVAPQEDTAPMHAVAQEHRAKRLVQLSRPDVSICRYYTSTAGTDDADDGGIAARQAQEGEPLAGVTDDVSKVSEPAIATFYTRLHPALAEANATAAVESRVLQLATQPGKYVPPSRRGAAGAGEARGRIDNGRSSNGWRKSGISWSSRLESPHSQGSRNSGPAMSIRRATSKKTVVEPVVSNRWDLLAGDSSSSSSSSSEEDDG